MRLDGLFPISIGVRMGGLLHAFLRLQFFMVFLYQFFCMPFILLDYVWLIYSILYRLCVDVIGLNEVFFVKKIFQFIFSVLHLICEIGPFISSE